MLYFLDGNPIKAASYVATQHLLQQYRLATSIYATYLKTKHNVEITRFSTLYRGPYLHWVAKNKKNLKWLCIYCYSLLKEYVQRTGDSVTNSRAFIKLYDDYSYLYKDVDNVFIFIELIDKHPNTNAVMDTFEDYRKLYQEIYNITKMSYLLYDRLPEYFKHIQYDIDWYNSKPPTWLKTLSDELEHKILNENIEKLTTYLMTVIDYLDNSKLANLIKKNNKKITTHPSNDFIATYTREHNIKSITILDIDLLEDMCQKLRDIGLFSKINTTNQRVYLFDKICVHPSFEVYYVNKGHNNRRIREAKLR